MRGFLTALALGISGMAGAVSAQQSVVVVELYTSQGCSSCPAADEILTEVSAHDHVLALGLHVDYWDYLGWKDELAKPEFTERQARFNTIMKSRYRLVTPQMIFQGQDYVAGAKRSKALEYIEMFAQAQEAAKLDIRRDGDAVRISLKPGDTGSVPSDLHVVEFTPAVPVKIKKGENAGRHITYTNTVTAWTTVAEWDGANTLELNHPISAGQEVAVIVQTKNLGPVLVARRLD